MGVVRKKIITRGVDTGEKMWDNTQREGKVSSSTTKEKETFDMGGHSSGPSSYEIAMKEEKARKAEEARLAAEKASKIAEANASASADGEAAGGEAELYDGGALTKKKKGSTLAGEGAQTFGSNGNLGG